jgi:hypothetical protein|tara:strand:- start:7377 stop:8102 length:726 start_codon:yes stop_codon:yes gene_type:complete
MSTYRKLISDIRSTHKILSTDALITDRAISSEIKTNALVLIKRETNLRRLWASDTLFTTIPCLEMCEVPISECCDYVDPCTVAKSKYKLPKISEGNYQYVIQGVYSINAMGGSGTKIKEITINRYLNLLKLPMIKKESYFWISNGYLYLSNPLVESIRISAFFEENIPKEIMYPDCKCNTNYSTEDYCMNPLDRESFVPGYLEQQTLAMTSTKLLNTYFNIKSDMSNEGIDGQAPNSQPTN